MIRARIAALLVAAGAGSVGTPGAQAAALEPGIQVTIPACGPQTIWCAGRCVDPALDPRHCGSCGQVCPPEHGCLDGTCRLRCPAGQLACGERCVDPLVDRVFCGASGDCSAANAGRSCALGELCASGSCLLECPEGTLACSGRCIDPLSNRAFCGAVADCAGPNLGVRCGRGELCLAGLCQVECKAGLVLCDGRCVEPLADPTHCGASGDCAGARAGALCPAGQQCLAGKCQASCAEPQLACGELCVDPRHDPDHCGACAQGCPSFPNAAEVCVASRCSSACLAGFLDCNRDAADGCETDTTADPRNCGGCDRACTVANGTPACVAAACAIGACAKGFGDCDGALQSGCETATSTSSSHCGACGHACAAGEGCIDGRCTSLYWASGVQQQVPVRDLFGWTRCHSGTYAESVNLSGLLARCKKPRLLLACRRSRAPSFTLLAMGPREEVLFECGAKQDCTRQSNGVGWYFNADSSWGFAPGGLSVHRISCDYNLGAQPAADLRMCWHTEGGKLGSGFRCGDNAMGDGDWVREIWQAD